MSADSPTLIGLPYDASSSFLRGAAAAPPSLRLALRSGGGNNFTEDLRDLSAGGALVDMGDLALPDSLDAFPLIEAAIGELLAAGGRPLALGGDHSVTFPIVRAVHHAMPSCTLLQIDAHPDLYDEYEGNPFSHACPFARIMEERLVVHLVQVGIRAMTAHQRAQADRFDVEVIDMRAWASGVRPTFSGPVYVSIDLDGLDPAFAPGVSHREPGGLSVRDVVGLLQSIPGPLIGGDVVELNPSQDPLNLTAAVGAKLIKELASGMLRSVQRPGVVRDAL
jgi:agmatinase